MMQLAGDEHMAGDEKADHYWREVLKGAWASTLDLVGWDKKKALSAAFVPIGTLVITGISSGFSALSTIISLVVGVALLVPMLFVWGIIQTQAKMYRDIAKQPSSAPLVAPIKPDRTRAADFEKWRHVEILELPKAAQLWEGERPSLALKGPAAETYAMLCAAIKKGELRFMVSAISSDPSYLETARQMEQSEPTTYTKVTRAGLKAFAAKYGYDPEFLRDRTTGAE
jgi:hypothetical protein